ncbi:hypothetical protein SAMN05192552_102322 [Natrinema hispanicum]|uniref:Uncharacterized protein n=1 Tax=Natrinema hispanicum TaxID=392421 RepID=A0A1G6UT66_9EURY|nr:hypothetical protein SAMN05192552_102322 [Natrinema hispanicum]
MEANEWLFDFDIGLFTIRRARHDIGEVSSDGVETTLLTLKLEPYQVFYRTGSLSSQRRVDPAGVDVHLVIGVFAVFMDDVFVVECVVLIRQPYVKTRQYRP